MAGKTLRLLIDARKLLHGGIGVYTANLIAGLLEVAPQKESLDLAVMGSSEAVAQFSWASQVEVIEDTTKPYSLQEYLALGSKISKLGRVFHTPHYVLPRSLHVPAFVTVHDLIHVNAPERWYYPLIAKPLLRSALRRASGVFTVSEASAREIREFMPDPLLSRKLFVVPNVLNSALLRQGSIDRERPYLLSVLSMNKPHKGLSELLEAFRLLRSDSRWSTLRLLIVGEGSEKIERDRIPENVEIIGRVSTAQLGRLYSGACAVVVSSRVEGFSLPVLEAQSLGSAVVSGPIPAVKELLTRFDVLCEQFGSRALCDGIKEILQRRLVEQEDRNDVESIRARFDRGVIARRILTCYREVFRDAVSPWNARTNEARL